MRRAGVAIAATGGATPIRVHAITEGDVGAVVLGDDAPGAIGQVFGGPIAEAVEVVAIGRDVSAVEDMDRPTEPMGRVELRAPALASEPLFFMAS